jgi:heme exporter protein D
MSYLPFLAPVLAFVAALTGLLGPSRKPDLTGFAALTGFGWAAAAFALIALALTLANTVAQRKALARAEAQIAQMRATARDEFQDAIALIGDVLTFAALMPYTTGRNVAAGGLPFDAGAVDLRGARTLEDLAGLRLDPSARLNAPYIPAAVPFSPTDRTAMQVLSQEAARVLDRLQAASAIYAARAVDAEVLDAASRLRQAPFLQRLTQLQAKWDARSRIEDATSPEVVNLYFLSDTVPPSPDGYLDLLDRMDRLRAALGTPPGRG